MLAMIGGLALLAAFAVLGLVAWGGVLLNQDEEREMGRPYGPEDYKAGPREIPQEKVW